MEATFFDQLASETTKIRTFQYIQYMVIFYNCHWLLFGFLKSYWNFCPFRSVLFNDNFFFLPIHCAIFGQLYFLNRSNKTHWLYSNFNLFNLIIFLYCPTFLSNFMICIQIKFSSNLINWNHIKWLSHAMSFNCIEK